MNRPCRTIGALLILVATAAHAEIGTIVYIEGEVTVVRNGERIWEDIDFGFRLESFDLIETGRTGLVELLVNQPAGLEATITVQSNTSFYLDSNRSRTREPAGVELLGGSVRVALQRYGAGFEVRTQVATMGVRGTVFDVVTSVQGDILVTCTEGSVVCSTDGGPQVVASPGRAVEARLGEQLRNLTVGGASVESFQAGWIRERFLDFQSDPIPIIGALASRYLTLRGQFRDAYARLMDRRDILDTWMLEDQRGGVGSMMDRMRERRAVLPALLEMRRVLFFLERIWFRLDALLENLDPQIAERELDPGLTVSELAQQFEDDAALLAARMAEVRYVFKLFAERNDGRLPFDDIRNDFDDESPTEDPFSDEPFSRSFPLQNQGRPGM